MALRLERTDERLTRRSGLVLIDRFGKRLDIAKRIDSVFPAPGSNRGFLPSVYVTTLLEMMIDGGSCLEDVRAFRDDAAYQAMTNRDHYPTSDALGDWLRRHGEHGGAAHIGQVNGELVRTMTVERDLTLDIDTTLIASDKGDAEVCYEGFRAYNPLVGICTELGLFVAARFQQGNVSPQSDLHSFIEQCTMILPSRITTVRSDSAAYNHDVMNFCFQHQLRFTITADHDAAVMAAIATIPQNAWKQGVSDDGSPASYKVAEVLHTMNQTHQSFRLVVKRTERYNQLDLFEAYHYWIVATNIPASDKDTQAIITFHSDRGEMERLIGELKHHLHLDHLPCGQFSANSLYFSIGVLAFNLVQLLKRKHFGQQWKTRSISSLRYLWLHAPAKLISHARSLVARIALAKDLFDELNAAYLHIAYAPDSG
jgi:hypothetical protein